METKLLEYSIGRGSGALPPVFELRILTPSQLETRFGEKLLEYSIGRGSGALRSVVGLRKALSLSQTLETRFGDKTTSI